MVVVSAFYHDQEFVDPSLEVFTPQILLKYLAKHNLTWEERDHGQLFGLQSAQELVNAYVYDCERLKCKFLFSQKILSVQKSLINEQDKNEDIFIVKCQGKNNEKSFKCSNIVLALGSSAWAQVGASAFGLQLAKQFGHQIKPFTPALTTLHLAKDAALINLSGISLQVSITIHDFSHTEALLFTHKGISGPVVLQASSYWQEGQEININFLPHLHIEKLLDSSECAKLFVRSLINRHLPQRLTDAILPQELARRKIAELSRKARKEIHNTVHNYTITPIKTGGMHKAEAALGGVLTKEINPWSMESLLCEKLFIVGELLDITGYLGGYNLHWAFASGHVAGLNVR